MKTYIHFLIIIGLFFSCENKDIYSTDLNAFLDKKDSELLNYLVTDFENSFLKKEYKNKSLDEAYLNFLEDIKSNKEFKNTISDKSWDMYYKSNLRLEKYTVVDSVWVVEDSIQDFTEDKELLRTTIIYPALKYRTKTLQPDGSFDYGFSIDDNYNLRDSIIRKQALKQKLKLVNENMFGSYNSFLRQKSETDNFIYTFFNKKEAAGMMQQELKSSGFLYHNIDVNNPLMRQIIVLEFVY
jgi:hypothetical protein